MVDNRQNEGGSNRRSFVKAGLGTVAAMAGVASLSGRAAASNPTALPNLYPNLNAENFQAIRAHEITHVSTVVELIEMLGGTPRPEPTFQNLLQTTPAAFGTVSKALENTGVGAYLGAAPVIFAKNVLAAAASIALIEARHAGYLNTLFNETSTTNVFGSVETFEQALTIAQVVDNASPFVKSLNGGPALTFSTTPSAANDIAILNFALALEYLERDFYNLNVPVFFPS